MPHLIRGGRHPQVCAWQTLVKRLMVVYQEHGFDPSSPNVSSQQGNMQVTANTSTKLGDDKSSQGGEYADRPTALDASGSASTLTYHILRVRRELHRRGE